MQPALENAWKDALVG